MRAYKLPLDDLEPESDFCAKVYIPNNDTYRRAFLGAYLSFGSWPIWERDSEHSALVAASRWRDSIDRTMAEWSLGCLGEGGDGQSLDDMTKDELIQIIEDIMTITITNNVCGCCGGGVSSGGAIGDDYDIPYDYDVPPTDSDNPPYAVSLPEKCNRASYIMYQYRLACLTWKDNIALYSAFSKFWEFITGAMWSGYPPAYEMYVQLKMWAENQMITEQFVEAFDPYYNEMVCALFSADNANQGRAAVRQVLESNVFGAVAIPLALAYKKIWESLPVEAVYDGSLQIALPASFQGRECCGGVPVGDGTTVGEIPDIETLQQSFTIVPVDYVNFSSYEESILPTNEGHYVKVKQTGAAKNEAVRMTPKDFSAYATELGGFLGWLVKVVSKTDNLITFSGLRNSSNNDLVDLVATNCEWWYYGEVVGAAAMYTWIEEHNGEYSQVSVINPGTYVAINLRSEPRYMAEEGVELLIFAVLAKE